jgi:ribosomal protein L7/L12
MRSIAVPTTVVYHNVTDAEYELIYSLSNSKVVAIKFIRAQYGLGLKTAKDLCDTIWDHPYTKPEAI